MVSCLLYSRRRNVCKVGSFFSQFYFLFCFCFTVSFDDESSTSSSSTGIGSGCGNGSRSFSETKKRDVRVSPANVDLLFKLFDNIDQTDRRRKLQLKFKSSKQIRSNHVHMSRGLLSKELIKGEDPCIIDAVSKDLFPLLRLDKSTAACQLDDTVGSVRASHFSPVHREDLALTTPLSVSMSQVASSAAAVSSSSVLAGLCDLPSLISPPSVSLNSGQHSSSSSSSSHLLNSSTLNFLNTFKSYDSASYFMLAKIHHHHHHSSNIGGHNYEQNYSQELSEVVAAL